MKAWLKAAPVLWALFLLPDALAQGAGAQVNLLTPVGLQNVSFTYLDVSSNFRFGQTQIGKVDIDNHSGIFSYAYRFDAFGRFAQFGLAASYVDIDAVGKLESAAGEEDVRETLSRRGMGDPSISLRLGLMGAPALSMQEWLEYEAQFEMYANVGVFIPAGKYDREFIINPGFNRWAYEFSLPMVVPLDPAPRQTFLEITPKALFFADNTEPFGDTVVLEQDPLYLIELQLSHRIRERFWMSLGFQYQQGGRTVSDGRPNDDDLDQYFGEIALGYRVARAVAMSVTYGRIFGQANDARGNVWRIRAAIVF